MTGLALLTPRPTQADALGGRPRPVAGRGPRGTPTLLCASGRGGSGTSLVSALLAVAAAGEGHRVVLVDADDFVGPLALLLGVSPKATWLDLRGGRLTAADVATPVSTTLTLVAGGPPVATPLAPRSPPPSAAPACSASPTSPPTPTWWWWTRAPGSIPSSPPSAPTPTSAWWR